MIADTIKIASRNSPMAMWQANLVKNKLLEFFPQHGFEIIGIATSGDKDTTKPLQQLGGKNLFVKELQQALLDNEADLAVHCVKDMSVHPIPQLTIACYLTRDDPRDALLSLHDHTLETLPSQAVVGTSSPRRTGLLKRARPDLRIKPLRGNVNTRINKLMAGEYDAIILSSAGLSRLGLTQHIQQYLPTDSFLPAIGQGALAIECLRSNNVIQNMVNTLHDPSTATCIEAERAVNRLLQGDCHSAIGAYCQQHSNALTLTAMVASTCGKEYIDATANGAVNDCLLLGKTVAKKLLDKGAKKILDNNTNRPSTSSST